MEKRYLKCILALVLIVSFIDVSAALCQENDFSIQHHGLTRTYHIHIPPSFDKTRSMPLVIALHGGGGTGKKMEELTLGGFNTFADKEGFIVVYPDGIEKHWNDGREEASYRAHKKKIDDVGFISALIDELVKKYNIDKARVYATGMSNGCMMSHLLAIKLSGKIAAIAPVGAALPKAHSNVKPQRPVPVLMISGTKDPLVPYDGGDIRFGQKKLGKVLSASETVKFWVGHNKCRAKPVVTMEPDKDPKDGTRVRRETYIPEKDGAEVVFCAIENGGHTWPGGKQYLPEWIVGKTSRDIDANELIWNFFKKHSMQ